MLTVSLLSKGVPNTATGMSVLSRVLKSFLEIHIQFFVDVNFD